MKKLFFALRVPIFNSCSLQLGLLPQACLLLVENVVEARTNLPARGVEVNYRSLVQ
jgi:hypothetical protein